MGWSAKLAETSIDLDLTHIPYQHIRTVEWIQREAVDWRLSNNDSKGSMDFFDVYGVVPGYIDR